MIFANVKLMPQGKKYLKSKWGKNWLKLMYSKILKMRIPRVIDFTF